MADEFEWTTERRRAYEANQRLTAMAELCERVDPPLSRHLKERAQAAIDIQDDWPDGVVEVPEEVRAEVGRILYSTAREHIDFFLARRGERLRVSWRWLKDHESAVSPLLNDMVHVPGTNACDVFASGEKLTQLKAML